MGKVLEVRTILKFILLKTAVSYIEPPRGKVLSCDKIISLSIELSESTLFNNNTNEIGLAMPLSI